MHNASFITYTSCSYQHDVLVTQAENVHLQAHTQRKVIVFIDPDTELHNSVHATTGEGANSEENLIYHRKRGYEEHNPHIEGDDGREEVKSDRR